uniref:Uncharacterized protein n=1 Tax=Lepeophtheirus salmonis TaxID=72036 RepID=A0A0K2V253_LEPSM
MDQKYLKFLAHFLKQLFQNTLLHSTISYVVHTFNHNFLCHFWRQSFVVRTYIPRKIIVSEEAIYEFLQIDWIGCCWKRLTKYKKIFLYQVFSLKCFFNFAGASLELLNLAEQIMHRGQ